MPRVNRDLQRRMAARRERERRRPSGERRYRFAAPEPAVEPDEAVLESPEVTSEPAEAPPSRRSRAAREAAVATQPARARGGTKTVPKPFSAYKEEYAYVYSDLRRVALVVGSLLLVLIVLYVLFPLLVR